MEKHGMLSPPIRSRKENAQPLITPVLFAGQHPAWHMT